MSGHRHLDWLLGGVCKDSIEDYDYEKYGYVLEDEQDVVVAGEADCRQVSKLSIGAIFEEVTAADLAVVVVSGEEEPDEPKQLDVAQDIGDPMHAFSLDDSDDVQNQNEKVDHHAKVEYPLKPDRYIC